MDFTKIRWRNIRNVILVYLIIGVGLGGLVYLALILGREEFVIRICLGGLMYGSANLIFVVWSEINWAIQQHRISQNLPPTQPKLSHAILTYRIGIVTGAISLGLLLLINNGSGIGAVVFIELTWLLILLLVLRHYSKSDWKAQVHLGLMMISILLISIVKAVFILFL